MTLPPASRMGMQGEVDDVFRAIRPEVAGVPSEGHPRCRLPDGVPDPLLDLRCAVPPAAVPEQALEHLLALEARDFECRSIHVYERPVELESGHEQALVQDGVELIARQTELPVRFFERFDRRRFAAAGEHFVVDAATHERKYRVFDVHSEDRSGAL